MEYKLDILAIVAHPDDAELACSGTLVNAINEGKKIGVVDLTQGELGSRGTIETRAKEAAAASKIMGFPTRENLQMADGFFTENNGNLLKVVEVIRKYRPDLVITNAIEDRHPDHGRASQLVSRACFLSGLSKIETSVNGNWQKKWRPKFVYHAIQDRYIKPDFVVDISETFETKMEAIKAFKTQFYDPSSKEPQTPISSEDFLEFIEGRAREFGRSIGVTYGEGFTVERPIGVKSLFDLH